MFLRYQAIESFAFKRIKQFKLSMKIALILFESIIQSCIFPISPVVLILIYKLPHLKYIYCVCKSRLHIKI